MADDKGFTVESRLGRHHASTGASGVPEGDTGIVRGIGPTSLERVGQIKTIRGLLAVLEEMCGELGIELRSLLGETEGEKK